MTSSTVKNAGGKTSVKSVLKDLFLKITLVYVDRASTTCQELALIAI